jgi:hypothetical protein
MIIHQSQYVNGTIASRRRELENEYLPTWGQPLPLTWYPLYLNFTCVLGKHKKPHSWPPSHFLDLVLPGIQHIAYGV